MITGLEPNEEKAQNEVQYFTNVRRNPLADYLEQTKTRNVKRSKKLGETSLPDDVRFDLRGMNPQDEIYFTEEYGHLDYLKLITSASNRDLMLSLGGTTLKVFLWIAYTKKYKGDVVLIEYDQMQKLGLKMSRGAFGKAIQELETHRIIKRVSPVKRGAEYWTFFINPQIIFKGDAKKYYQTVLNYHPDYLKPL